MAHLPQDELPSEFDVVVDGTGLVQSILAAALSRAGKSVLHLDRNSYYGELWGSLMHREMQQWMTEHRSRDQEATPQGSRDYQPHPPPYTLSERERVLEIARPPPPLSVTNLVEIVHTHGEESCESEGVRGVTSESGSGESAVGEDRSGEGGESAVGEDGSGEGGESAVGEDGSGKGGESAVGEGGSGKADEGDSGEAPPTTQQSSKVTWQSLEPEWRRFNFDLIPKCLYCRGEMVDCITESSCSRYIEFKAVGGIFSYKDNSIQQVPCSRSDVFSSKVVTMMEKRKMMKFLTFCADYTNHPQEYQGSESMLFEDYLNTKELTPNLVNYILHSIAMVPNSATTIEGLQAMQVFINSLGRYGNAPFLFPIFGGGELPQAFCRLSAVYGGVYCLQRHVSSVITSSGDNSTVTAVVCSSGQRIKCSWVVLSSAFFSQMTDFRDQIKTTRTSRGIFVTDSPLPGTDGKLSLLTFPPGSLGDSAHTSSVIRVLQLDPTSNNCPPGTFLMHMQYSSGSQSETAREDLQPAVRALFTDPLDTDPSESKPRLLWSLYYNTDLHSTDHTHQTGLRGLYLTSEPDTSIGYEKAVKEARELFADMCPDQEFLPHPPNPDDIIFEDSGSNHGDEEEATATGEGGSSNGDKKNESEAPPTNNEATPTNNTDDTSTSQTE